MVQTVRAPIEAPMSMNGHMAAPVRRRRGRVSRAAALTWVAACLAFVLTASLLRDRSAQVEVLVAATDIPAGAEITDSMVEVTTLDADSPLAGGLLASDGLRPGQTAATPIEAGSPLRRADLVDAARSDGLRSMSIEVDRAQAVGGALTVGDRVDVIDVVDGEAGYVVRDAEVTGIPAEPTGRGITGGGSSSYFIVVRVDADTALALAGAVDRGALQVVRSTGATPIDGTSGADGSVSTEEGSGG
jgi:Flp pilus assembly protein CpaB